MAWIAANLNWLIPTLLLIATEIVHLTPTKKDDIVVDMILKPIWEAFSKNKKI